MLFSLNWIKEYISVREKPETIADTLTKHAFETSVAQSPLRADFSQIFVGEVESITQHPNADRLSVVTVRIGKTKRRVVCGAPNVREGMRVAFASPGTQIVTPEGTIERMQTADIRGVKSPGMLCSPRELGLSDEHEGILEIPPDVRVGTRLSTVFPQDMLLDADILPDRAADASSHIGVARELSVLLGKNIKLPSFKLPKVRSKQGIKIEIEDPEECPRYIAVRLSNIVNGSSPAFIQRGLWSIGIRPQNLIVDVTNYVLWETGQPTHAFDTSRLSGKKIGVRRARARDKSIVTLDGELRKLTSDVLLVTSDDKPVALAGIMGGEETAVHDTTSSILLESALFHSGTVRNSARTVGLRTDASDRFSRGMTDAYVERGAARVIELLVEYGGARVDSITETRARKTVQPNITVSHSKIEEVLGMEIPKKTVQRILHSLGCVVRYKKDEYHVQGPEFRRDIVIPADIIEEIGRIIGYEKIPARTPKAPITPVTLPPAMRDIRNIQDILKGAGWTETITYSFTSELETEALGIGELEHIGVVNPMNPNQKRIRTSLLPNLLAVARNGVKQEPVIRMFEIGFVHVPKNKEERHFAGVFARRSGGSHSDFYEVKGVLELITEELNLPDIRFHPVPPTSKRSLPLTWDPGSVAEIRSGSHRIGFVGLLASDTCSQLKIHGTVTAFVMYLSKIDELNRLERVYNPPLPFPPIRRDVALALPLHVRIDEVLRTISEAGGELVQDVDMIDMYGKEEKNSRGITVRILFGSPDRTLTDSEVNALQKTILNVLVNQLDTTER